MHEPCQFGGAMIRCQKAINGKYAIHIAIIYFLIYYLGMYDLISLNREPASHVLLISGPDYPRWHDDPGAFGNIFDKAHKYLQKKEIMVSKVGNGKLPINAQEISRSIAALPEDSIILIGGHGKVEKETHYLNNMPDRIPTTTLLDMIGLTHRRMNVAIMACFASVANDDDVHVKIPADSVVATFDAGAELKMPTIGFSLSPSVLGAAIDNRRMAFGRFLLHCLPHLDQYDSSASPKITIAGRGSCELRDMLAERVGKRFTPDEREDVEARICEMEPTVDFDPFREIETESPRIKPGGDRFGSALAVTLAAAGGAIRVERCSSSVWPG